MSKPGSMLTKILLLTITMIEWIRSLPAEPGSKLQELCDYNDRGSSVFIKNTQGEIMATLDLGTGKAADPLNQPEFSLRSCSAGNSPIGVSQVYILSGWVRLEQGMLMAPKTRHQSSKYFDKTHGPQLIQAIGRTFELYDFFNGEEGMMANQNYGVSEDHNELSVPVEGQKWVFYSWKVVTDATQGIEMSFVITRRSKIESEKVITVGQTGFDHAKTVLETCTSMVYTERSSYADEKLTLKTSSCVFKGLREVWMDVNTYDSTYFEDQFFDLNHVLMMGGEYSMQKRLSFVNINHETLQAIFKKKQFNEKNFKAFVSRLSPEGLKLLQDEVEFNSQILREIKLQPFLSDQNGFSESAVITFSGKVKVFMENVEGADVFKGNITLKSESGGVESDLTKLEINVEYNAVYGAYFPTCSLYLPGYNGLHQRVEVSAEADYSSPSTRLGSDSIGYLSFSVTIQILPGLVLEPGMVGARTGPVRSFIQIDLAVSVFSTYGYEQTSLQESLRSVSSILPLMMDEFFFLDFKQDTPSATAMAIFEGMNIGSGGGNVKNAFTGAINYASFYKLESKEEITINYVYLNGDSGCITSFLGSNKCPGCKPRGSGFFYDDAKEVCSQSLTNGLPPTGCAKKFNNKQCQTCEKAPQIVEVSSGVAPDEGYFFDPFNKLVSCRKVEKTCPHNQAAYELNNDIQQTMSQKACFSCPANCKECFASGNNGEFFYCKTPSAFAKEAAIEPFTIKPIECKVENCELCEKKKCDRCKKGYTIYIEHKTGEIELKIWCEKERTSVLGVIECKGGFSPAGRLSNEAPFSFCSPVGAIPNGYYSQSGSLSQCPIERNQRNSDYCPVCSTKETRKIFDDPLQGLYQSTNQFCQYCEDKGKQYREFYSSDVDVQVICDNIEEPFCTKKEFHGNCYACDEAVLGIQLVNTIWGGIACGCSNGYYLDVAASKCQKCPENCQSCFLNGESGAMECRVCSSYQLKEQTIVLEWLEKESTCNTACSVPFCHNCGGLGNCNRCYKGYYLAFNKAECVKGKCPEGEWLAEDGYQCRRCAVKNCNKCSVDENVCEECFNNFYFFIKGGKTHCDKMCPGFFSPKEGTDQLSCEKCQKGNCVKCMNPGTEEEQCRFTEIKLVQKYFSKKRLEFQFVFDHFLEDQDFKTHATVYLVSQAEEKIKVEGVKFELEEKKENTLIIKLPESIPDFPEKGLDGGRIEVEFSSFEALASKQQQLGSRRRALQSELLFDAALSSVYSDTGLSYGPFSLPDLSSISNFMGVRSLFRKVFNIITGIGLFFCPSTAIEMVKLGQFLDLLDMINLEFPVNLAKFLENFDKPFLKVISDFFSNLLLGIWRGIGVYFSPKEIKKHEAEIGCFPHPLITDNNLGCYILGNSGGIFVLTLIILIVKLLFKLLSKYVKGSSGLKIKLNRIFKKINDSIGKEFFFKFAMVAQMDLITAVMINYGKFRLNKILALISSLLTVVLSGCYVLFDLNLLQILYKMKITDKNEYKFLVRRLKDEYREAHKGKFKSIERLYIALRVIRDFLYPSCIVIFINSASAQLGSSVILFATTLLTSLIFRPYKTQPANIFNCLNEFIYIVVLLLFAALNSFGLEMTEQEQSDKIGRPIIWIVVIMLIIYLAKCSFEIITKLAVLLIELVNGTEKDPESNKIAPADISEMAASSLSTNTKKKTSAPASNVREISMLNDSRVGLKVESDQNDDIMELKRSKGVRSEKPAKRKISFFDEIKSKEQSDSKDVEGGEERNKDKEELGGLQDFTDLAKDKKKVNEADSGQTDEAKANEEDRGNSRISINPSQKSKNRKFEFTKWDWDV